MTARPGSSCTEKTSGHDPLVPTVLPFAYIRGVPIREARRRDDIVVLIGAFLGRVATTCVLGLLRRLPGLLGGLLAYLDFGFLVGLCSLSRRGLFDDFFVDFLNGFHGSILHGVYL